MERLSVEVAPREGGWCIAMAPPSIAFEIIQNGCVLMKGNAT
jgi:hypothetical protein